MWRGAALLLAVPLLVACALQPTARISGAGAGAAAAATLEPPAPLYSWLSAGAPGSWTPNRVIGTHLQVPCAYNSGKCFHPGLIIEGAVATRSPATSGPQSVLVQTTIQKPDKVFGGWMLDIQDVQELVIPAGTDAVRFQDRSWVLNTAGAKHVRFLVLWGDAQAQVVGALAVDMDQSADYVCLTNFTWACGVYDGFVSIASPS